MQSTAPAKYLALHDYTAAEEGEMTFEEGDVSGGWSRLQISWWESAVTHQMNTLNC